MKLFLFFICLTFSVSVFCQNYIFTGTGNNHNKPYGVINNWSWDTAAYKKFSYKSPLDNFYMPYRLLSPPGNDLNKKYPLFVMLHGGGEGIGTATDLSLHPNTAQMMWGAQISLDSSSKYPSFVFFPQTQGGWWGSNGVPNYSWHNSNSWTPVRVAFEIIDILIQQHPNIDKDRIYIAGLSIGARGAWEMLERRPDLFAAATPFQGMGDSTLASTLINNPIWNYQGGQDRNPASFETQALYDVMVKKGGNPRRSEYVDRDHWSWVDAHQSKTWMQWVYAQDKKNINILFGKAPSICSGQSIKLGIGYGFVSYQWKKDGVNIPGATTYVQTVSSPGTYTVIFQRKSGEFVTSNAKLISGVAKPDIALSNSPALPVGGSVVLAAPAGEDKYFWSNNATSRSITVSAAGQYQVTVTKGSSCSSASNAVVVTIGKAPSLNAPSYLSVVTETSHALLSWIDNASNETGYEVIYSTAPNGGTIFYSGVLPANTTNYTAGNLAPLSTYYAKVRAINNQGYSDYSQQTSFSTGTSNIAPVANAGPDISVVLPISTPLIINGSGTDADGLIVSYQWTKISGPAATLNGAATASLSLTNLSAGTYVFRLKVVDNAVVSASDDDDITLVVKPAVSGQSITGFMLVDADKDVDIAALTNGYVINLANSTVKNYSIVAKTSPASVGSVSLILKASTAAGYIYRLESASPYSLTGTCFPGATCYNSWWKPAVGAYTIQATPYSATNATGTMGTPLTLNFSVINFTARMSVAENASEEMASVQASFTPNPVKDKLTIRFNERITGNVASSITDAMGKNYLEESRLLDDSEMEIDLSTLNMVSGIYFVKIVSDHLKTMVFKASKE